MRNGNPCTKSSYHKMWIRTLKRISALLGDTEKMVMEVYNHILLEKEDAVGAVNATMNI